MSDIEELRAEIKKLSSRAVKAKMDLHDLSEDLPIGWTNIPEVAARAHDAYATLEARRTALRALEEKEA
ncbi:hypothetical protein GOB86_02900 [Acetobacter lambici]|uniref:Uncharacterized protein n=1 Tax=Acetobacter lambici TaxID=1332824 RepID=A0ABT1EYV8_9PROT|nr:CCE_0567 family metalloprotein [Acetobacter lambici]MCP1242175.1 hypothetical protein [Acetobacter lambici]MCP1258141.1 hypothetical protein [Acetobacter lambici]NHO56031.1 hypothetical protein [Acetobacter lambici]